MKVKRTIKEIDSVLQKIKELLESIYGNRLLDVILYGSFVRNEATVDSDIDIAVVLKDTVNKIEEIDKMHDILYPLLLEYGEFISVNPISTKELGDIQWPLYYHINNEGIRV